MSARSFGQLARRQLGTASGKSDSRKKLIGAVHGAASRHGLTDDDRRAMQLDVTGKASLSEMTLAQIGMVLDKLNKNRSAERGAKRPHEGKIRALWWTLHWLGEPVAREPNDFAINHFISNRFGISNLRFVDGQSGSKIIEGMKAIAARAGVRWPGEADIKRHAAQGNRITIQQLERHAVIAAIMARLADAGLVRRGVTAYDYVETAVGLDGRDHLAWTETNLDSAIKIIGKKYIRSLKAVERLADASDEDAQ